MRTLSKKSVVVRSKEIGGSAPLICLPIVSAGAEDTIKQAQELMRYKPDIVEWRADAYYSLRERDMFLVTLQNLREAIGDTALIFTCRCPQEGGLNHVQSDVRLSAIVDALKSGCVDIVDYEISNGESMVAEVRRQTHGYGRKLILSHHNFASTPEEDFILGKLIEAQELGADIAKIAVTPQSYGDVLRLLSATMRARTESVSIPMISISMGLMGAVSRVAGGLFGSDVTFCVGQFASAPGQIPIDDLRTIWQMWPAQPFTEGVKD